MSITQHILTKYPFSCIIVIGTWILCFMTIPETPLSSVRFIDKWTHSLIYLVLGLSIREFGIRKGLKKLVISSKIRIFMGENQ